MEKTEIKYSFGFLDALTVLFVALKLTGFIAWSWWWVLSPILIPCGIIIVLLIILGLLMLVD